MCAPVYLWAKYLNYILCLLTSYLVRTSHLTKRRTNLFWKNCSPGESRSDFERSKVKANSLSVHGVREGVTLKDQKFKCARGESRRDFGRPKVKAKVLSVHGVRAGVTMKDQKLKPKV